MGMHVLESRYDLSGVTLDFKFMKSLSPSK